MLAILPLLATGPCVEIAQDALISGFFTAVTRVLVDEAETCLGIEKPPVFRGVLEGGMPTGPAWATP